MSYRKVARACSAARDRSGPSSAVVNEAARFSRSAQCCCSPARARTPVVAVARVSTARAPASSRSTAPAYARVRSRVLSNWEIKFNERIVKADLYTYELNLVPNDTFLGETECKILRHHLKALLTGGKGLKEAEYNIEFSRLLIR